MFDWLTSALEGAAVYSASVGIEWIADLGRPASEADIDACEAAIRTRLSVSQRAFMAMHNGGWLGIAVPRPGSGLLERFGVNILSTDEIVRETRYLSNVVFADEPSSQERFVAVASYGRSGDLVVLDARRVENGEAAIIDGWHEISLNWASSTVIATSFEEWVRLQLDSFVLRESLLTYWLSGNETVRELIESMRCFPANGSAT